MQRVVGITTTFTSGAVNAMNSLNRRQNDFDLPRLFEPGNLVSAEFRAKARDILVSLDTLLDENKELYSSYQVSFAQQLLNATDELTEDKRCECRRQNRRGG
jgi:hypothetical protein